MRWWKSDSKTQEKGGIQDQGFFIEIGEDPRRLMSPGMQPPLLHFSFCEYTLEMLSWFFGICSWFGFWGAGFRAIIWFSHRCVNTKNWRKIKIFWGFGYFWVLRKRQNQISEDGWTFWAVRWDVLCIAEQWSEFYVYARYTTFRAESTISCAQKQDACLIRPHDLPIQCFFFLDADW